MTPPYICHYELPATDLEAAAIFYETVFGASVMRNSPGPSYWFMTMPDGVGGALTTQRKPATDDTVGSLVFFEVVEIETTLATIESAGGTVVRGKSQIAPEIGWDAYFRDPSGAYIGLHQSPPRSN